jgi:two-component system response regulator PilR (NtrC family)
MKRILVVDDDSSIRNVLKTALSHKGYLVHKANDGITALELLDKNMYDLVITDLVMPQIDGIELIKKTRKKYQDCGFIVISAYGTIEKAVEAMQFGAFDFVTKPFSIVHIESKLNKYFEFRNLKAENLQLKRELSQEKTSRQIIGKSNSVSMILNQINMVAKSDAPVFIQGESGTGKELIAQAIHDNSNRSDMPFIKVNCPAIPETLFESTLFGHEKGAFTNAIKTTKGMFEEAEGGTILLDEISEIPINVQAKLLRVLQEGMITRIGSVKEIPVDIRVIATTNQNILKMIEDKTFRSDLFYRLNVFPIKVPPLRARIEDVPVLMNYFIENFKSKYGYEKKELDRQTMDALMKRNWPGNIRQLENMIERAILYSGNEDILQLDYFSSETENFPLDSGNPEDYVTSISEMEKKLIFNALKRTKGNRSQAAKILDISVRTLRNKLHLYEDSGVKIPEQF